MSSFLLTLLVKILLVALRVFAWTVQAWTDLMIGREARGRRRLAVAAHASRAVAPVVLLVADAPDPEPLAAAA